MEAKRIPSFFDPLIVTFSDQCLFWKLNTPLSNLVSFIRLNIFVKIDLWKWANDPFISGKPPDAKGQFALF